MWIREPSAVPSTSPTYFRAVVLEAIRDLEAEFRDGEISHDAYYFRLHALKRMLK